MLHTTRQTAFISSDIPDSQTLIDGILKGIETAILDPNRDAVDQITETLKGKQYSVIHIVSHGAAGHLQLGNTPLNIETLPQYTNGLQQWGESLTADASILLYGCNVAATTDWKTDNQKPNHPPTTHPLHPLKNPLPNFLAQLHQLTGAKIAANPQSTGNSALGGNWEIQQLIPPSPQSPKLPFTESALKTYSGILGLAPKVDFTTGSNPYSVSIGDFNGDGKPDLAVANYLSNTTSILLNTTATNATTPTFATKVDVNTGNGPNWVSIGDFNGDGKPDLAVANYLSNTTSILLNTTATGATTPTFATNVDFTTGNGPIWVSIGDFNGDGKPDLAVANFSSNTTSIILNTTTTNATTPTFAPKVDVNTGTNPRSVSIGDFNGDGKPDLAVANRDNNTTSIILNTTATNATTPTFAPKVDVNTGTNPRSVSIGDFNGDGKPDLAVVNYLSNTTSILLNTTATNATTPTFATKVDVNTGNGPISVSIGDFNGDGKPDLAVANFSSNTTSIILNTTTTNATTPTFAPKVDVNTGIGPISVSIGDFNGDGKPDLDVANRDSDTTSILLNTTPKISIAAGTTPTETGPTTGTFNITLDTPAPAGGLVINFNTTGSTAATPARYSLTAGTNITAVTANTFTIAAGQTRAVFNAVPVDDTIINPGETVRVNVTPDPNNFNYILDPVVTNRTATLTITDNDFPTVNLTVSPTTATETGSPAITVTTTASQAVVGNQTVNVALSGTATAADFTGTIPTSITIPAGKTTGSFTVNVNDDTLVEPTETGTFTISNPSSGIVLGTTTTGSVTITDNDVTRAPEIQVLDGTTDIVDGTLSAINFGSTLIGGTLNKTFTVKNLGTAALNLSNLTLPTGFSLVGTLPPTVAANASANLQVQVDTATAGNKTGTLQFVNNDSNENPFDFPISASVTVTPTPTPTPITTPTPTPTPTTTPTPVTDPTPPPVVTTPTPVNQEDTDCICDKIEYPNLNQPNQQIDNIINGGVLIGTPKNDAYFGSNKPNIFDAKEGNDNLFGGEFNDIFNGNKDFDFIDGKMGDDLLFGGKGNDIILGGFGEDIIFGDQGNDSINGQEDDDLIFGNQGNDFIDGGKGDDILLGGKGNDVILGSEGNDTLFGQLGDDTLCGGAGDDLVYGGQGNDLIDGGKGNDSIYGDLGNDTLLGCEGDDILFGGLGNNSLVGGLGNDIFVIGFDQGFNIISDFVKGQDLMGLSEGLGFNQLEISQNNNSALIKVKGNGEVIASLTGVNATSIGVNDFRIV